MSLAGFESFGSDNTDSAPGLKCVAQYTDPSLYRTPDI